MYMIGLTGGIGSGKSTVAEMLRAHDLPVVDADQIARDIMEPGSPVLDDVAAVFGADLIGSDGALDRAGLAARAFVSEEQTQKLNAITHPAIRAESARRFSQLERAGEKAAVYDMPLLIELGMNEDMDMTVVVDVDADERVRRLVAHRGLSEDDARNRIERQIPNAQRRAAADEILDNNGTLADLERQVEALVDKITNILLGV